jgi:hypothetical protein
MKYYRLFNDKIIISTVPHFMALFYTYKDIYYSLTLIMATTTSILWHKSRESSYRLLLLDYFFAGSLTGYELCKGKDSDKQLILGMNIALLILNKSIDFLSKYKVINYNKGHLIYHIASFSKTIYVAKINEY